VNVDTIRERARAAGFGDLADELAELARPAFVLEPASNDTAAGRLGGLPRLPRGNSWPQSRWSGVEPKPLAFLAEFDLAALDPSIWPGPTTGTLSFFCAINAEALYVDSGGAALVLHHAPAVQLSSVEIPEQLDENLRYREFPVAARPVMTLPFSGTEPELSQLGFEDIDEDRADAYYRMRAQLMGIPAHWAPHHQLLGWPRPAEDDLFAIWPQFHAQAVEYGLVTEDPPSDDWRVLFQIGSDYDRIGTEFGDGGSLTFAIPEGDLAVGRFDRVQAITDSL
jgi:hypothetical protein